MRETGAYISHNGATVVMPMILVANRADQNKNKDKKLAQRRPLPSRCAPGVLPRLGAALGGSHGVDRGRALVPVRRQACAHAITAFLGATEGVHESTGQVGAPVPGVPQLLGPHALEKDAHVTPNQRASKPAPLASWVNLRQK